MNVFRRCQLHHRDEDAAHRRGVTLDHVLEPEFQTDVEAHREIGYRAR
jgi:hypothetical protein